MYTFSVADMQTTIYAHIPTPPRPPRPHQTHLGLALKADNGHAILLAERVQHRAHRVLDNVEQRQSRVFGAWRENDNTETRGETRGEVYSPSSKECIHEESENYKFETNH